MEHKNEILDRKENGGRGEHITKLVLDKRYFVSGPGQCAELKMPKNPHYEWHRFTIASALNKKDTMVTFYIKAVGRWTNKLLEIAWSGDEENRKSSIAHLRCPHGTPAETCFKYRHLIVIATGIAVTLFLLI